jgi:hypothetical protein
MIYWCFLGFYGLVFPGYLWLHGFPGRSAGTLPTRHTMRVLLVAVAIAFPMYWMGFVEGRPVWLLPGLVVLLAARRATRRSTLPTHPTPASEL